MNRYRGGGVSKRALQRYISHRYEPFRLSHVLCFHVCVCVLCGSGAFDRHLVVPPARSLSYRYISLYVVRAQVNICAKQNMTEDEGMRKVQTFVFVLGSAPMITEVETVTVRSFPVVRSLRQFRGCFSYSCS